jgi:hypothetical protein
MNNFWENYGKSYAAFSQHCDNSDWRKILETISNEILNIGVNRPLNILDVGTGIGKNITEILEMLLSKTNRKIPRYTLPTTHYSLHFLWPRLRRRTRRTLSKR